MCIAVAPQGSGRQVDFIHEADSRAWDCLERRAGEDSQPSESGCRGLECAACSQGGREGGTPTRLSLETALELCAWLCSVLLNEDSVESVVPMA